VLGIRELAEMLDMSPATAYRYASTLVAEGYMEQDAQGKYRLDLGAIDLGLAALNATALCEHAHPDLEELCKRSGHIVQLAVLDGLEILVVGRVLAGTRAAQSKLQDSVQADSRLPAYCTSLGKVLLAYLPREQRLKLISEMELLQRGPRTITSKSALHAQLEDVRHEGLAINDEELLEGSCAIAAPVREESGDVIAAVGLVAYEGVIEIDDLVARFEGALRTTAARISARLGWQGVGE